MRVYCWKTEFSMNRRQLLRSAAVLPAVGGAFSATATQQKQIKITTLEIDVHKQPQRFDALSRTQPGDGSPFDIRRGSACLS
jgi:hypothetical protein